MCKRLFILYLLLASVVVSSHAQLAVGKWRDHLSYSSCYRVEEASDRIYCSSADGLFYYDLDDHTVNRLSKATNTRLSDVGISTFAYDEQTTNVVVAYKNANIDIIKDDKVVNINDIKRSNIGGNKNINNISFFNHKAYLACAFGVVVVDMNRDEISETYYLGNEGSSININDIVFTDSLIVAATDSGIYYAPKRSQLLNIYSSWSRDNGSLLVGQRVLRLGVDDKGHLLAMADVAGDTALYRDNGNMAFAPLVASDVKNFKISHGQVAVCLKNRVDIYDADGIRKASLADVDWMNMEANDALLTKDGRLWVAHNWASLVTLFLDGTGLQNFSPEGPWNSNAYRVVSFDSTLYLCPGGHRTTYAGVYNAADVYSYKNDKWQKLEDTDGILAGKTDVIDVAVNPRDKKQMMVAAWGNGILEVNDNKVTAFYDDQNSDGALVRYRQGSYSVVLTGGVAYDKKGNLWVTNSLVDAALAVRYADGKWKGFNTMGVVTSDIDRIIWDSINDLKLFWGRQNRIFVHDGDKKIAYIDPNNGAKLQTSTVNCVAQDHSGQLWIGTNKGIKVSYTLTKAFANGGNGEMSPVTCSNILFNENGITEYLMAYENVSCIAVDGANRKWVGTSTGGLYLLSANGLQQLEHFTAANSPLFSDKIISVAVMPWSGEVFVITDRGVQSYRGTATYAFDAPMEDIHAFPNPVRPDYDGTIAIKGFTRNAIVHITDAAGNTVYSTRAAGGQAVWDGRTHEGKKVASGVYYVFASAEDGTMRSATKILIVR